MIALDYNLSAADTASIAVCSSVANTTLMGVKNTFLLTEHILTHEIPGVFVECGSAAGAQLGAMGAAMKKRGKYRPIHVFDSFQGIPLAGPRDKDQPGLGKFLADPNLPIRERLRSSGVSATTTQQLRDNLNLFQIADLPFVFHEGWFQDTLPGLAMPEIALLRLDGDLYESTFCCLEHLYRFVASDGIVIIDDYGFGGDEPNGCQQAVHDFFNGKLPRFHSESDYGAVYFAR